jgi:hypothetical protein
LRSKFHGFSGQERDRIGITVAPNNLRHWSAGYRNLRNVYGYAVDRYGHQGFGNGVLELLISRVRIDNVDAGRAFNRVLRVGATKYSKAKFNNPNRITRKAVATMANSTAAAPLSSRRFLSRADALDAGKFTAS